MDSVNFYRLIRSFLPFEANLLCTLVYNQGVGELVLIGVPEEEKAELNYLPLLTGGRTIKGTSFGGVRIHSDLPKIVEKCIEKVIYTMFEILICLKLSTS